MFFSPLPDFWVRVHCRVECGFVSRQVRRWLQISAYHEEDQARWTTRKAVSHDRSRWILSRGRRLKWFLTPVAFWRLGKLSVDGVSHGDPVTERLSKRLRLTISATVFLLRPT